MYGLRIHKYEVILQQLVAEIEKLQQLAAEINNESMNKEIGIQ